MRIFQRDGKWCVDYFHRGRRVRRVVGPNRKQAEAVLAKVQSGIIEGTYFDVKKDAKVTFSEIAKRFQDSYASVNNKPSTLYRNSTIINVLSRHFGERYIFEIRDLDIEGYKKARLDAGRKHATVNRELALFRAITNKAKAWGLVNSNTPKISLFRVDNARIRYLGEGEARKLLEACPEPVKSIVILALNTGMRRGEILNLKLKDTNLQERYVTIRDTKSRKNRYIPLNRQALEVLENKRQDTGNEYVFPGDNPGSHLSESYLSHRFQRVVTKAGIKDFRFHDLRHTFASWLVMRGINLKTVQELLGHKTYQMTLKYAHLSPEHNRQAVEILDAMAEKFADKPEAGRIEHGTNLAQGEKARIL